MVALVLTTFLLAACGATSSSSTAEADLVNLTPPGVTVATPQDLYEKQEFGLRIVVQPDLRVEYLPPGRILLSIGIGPSDSDRINASAIHLD
jgi:hypothetical protein